MYEASTVDAKKRSELGKTFRKPDVPDLASVAGASLFRAKEKSRRASKLHTIQFNNNNKKNSTYQ